MRIGIGLLLAQRDHGAPLLLAIRVRSPVGIGLFQHARETLGMGLRGGQGGVGSQRVDRLFVRGLQGLLLFGQRPSLRRRSDDALLFDGLFLRQGGDIGGNRQRALLVLDGVRPHDLDAGLQGRLIGVEAFL